MRLLSLRRSLGHGVPAVRANASGWVLAADDIIDANTGQTSYPERHAGRNVPALRRRLAGVEGLGELRQAAESDAKEPQRRAHVLLLLWG
jgi:predicted ATPase